MSSQMISAAVFAAATAVVSSVLQNWRFDRLLRGVLTSVLPSDQSDDAKVVTAVSGTLSTALTAGIFEYLGQGIPVTRGIAGVNPLWTNAIASGLLMTLGFMTITQYMQPYMTHEVAYSLTIFLASFLSVYLLY